MLLECSNLPRGGTLTLLYVSSMLLLMSILVSLLVIKSSYDAVWLSLRSWSPVLTFIHNVNVDIIGGYAVIML